MMLHELLGRAESWPEYAQAELEQLVPEIDAELRGDTYRATPAERRCVERGLRDSAEGRFVSESDIEAIFARAVPEFWRQHPPSSRRLSPLTPLGAGNPRPFARFLDRDKRRAH